jgi:hypothetical protein
VTLWLVGCPGLRCGGALQLRDDAPAVPSALERERGAGESLESACGPVMVTSSDIIYLFEGVTLSPLLSPLGVLSG